MAIHESGERLNGRFDHLNVARALCVPLIAFLVSAVVLIWLSPLRGLIHSVELLPGAISLRTAGADPAAVFAAIGMNLVRLYLTAIPAALLVGGGLCGLLGRGRAWTLGIGAICGVLAAGTLTTLTGCHCGGGSTTPLWRSAAWAISNGGALVAVPGSVAVLVPVRGSNG